MVVALRIASIKECIQRGHSIHITYCQRLFAGRCKVKIKIGAAPGIVPPLGRQFLVAAIRPLESEFLQHVVVDRGHRFSSGNAFANFWVEPAARDDEQERHSNPDDSGEHGDDSGSHSEDESKRRPEPKREHGTRNVDPWHDGRTDPWGGSSAASPPQSDSPPTKKRKEALTRTSDDSWLADVELKLKECTNSVREMLQENITPLFDCSQEQAAHIRLLSRTHEKNVDSQIAVLLSMSSDIKLLIARVAALEGVPG